ncbi:uncharacterized protein LOC123306156 [Chrysoperla carnea]|uniref:uncharacterized protein LOC123306156 n=1 Tax=Chrysoperla carnea TaxID=189513 RepID=UPI001D08547F|nr:uncharacterized protein LOC123306156 [Chrysoperla carnea]
MVRVDSMQNLCKNHFLQHQYRKINGAVLWSQNERHLNCFITFQTHSILQRFMLRFDLLSLDCNDHLYIYDGAHPVGIIKANLSCRNSTNSVGSLLTRTNFVTLKYETDGWGTDANGFKLVITAVKDPLHACKDFHCTFPKYCIDMDLVCDGINHCPDGSDESASALCQNTETNTIFGMETTWFVVIVVCAGLLICAIITAIVVCICRRTSSDNTTGHRNAQNTSLQQMYGSNGAMKYTANAMGTSAVTTLPPGSTQCPTSTLVKMPGNWLHPAGPSTLGYRRLISHTIQQQAQVRHFIIQQIQLIK